MVFEHSAEDRIILIMKRESEIIKDFVENLCIHMPLYKKVKITEVNRPQISSLINNPGSIDSWCKLCSKASTFIFDKSSDTAKNGFPRGVLINMFPGATYGEPSPLEKSKFQSLHYLMFKCSREKDHKMIFYFLIQDESLMKIGQHPSLSDLHLSGLQKYKKVLDSQYLDEFKRAVGLASHGIGIGSFIYLRRIFEKIVFQTLAIAGDEIDRDTFNRARMDKKIDMLSSHLPKCLVENQAIYGILSKHIHALTENECLDHFEIVKNGIDLILDDWIKKKERQKKEKEIRSKVNKLNEKLRSGS